jgi:hypothetical protein
MACDAGALATCFFYSALFDIIFDASYSGFNDFI